MFNDTMNNISAILWWLVESEQLEWFWDVEKQQTRRIFFNFHLNIAYVWIFVNIICGQNEGFAPLNVFVRLYTNTCFCYIQQLNYQ